MYLNILHFKVCLEIYLSFNHDAYNQSAKIFFAYINMYTQTHIYKIVCIKLHILFMYIIMYISFVLNICNLINAHSHIHIRVYIHICAHTYIYIILCTHLRV